MPLRCTVSRRRFIASLPPALLATALPARAQERYPTRTIKLIFPFDVRRDIVKIALTAEFANVVVVNKDLPVNSIAELIAYLKARAGQLNFGSSGRATSDRLAAELFMLETGTKMQNVPYRGGGVALNDLIGGTTHVMFPQLPTVIGMASSGAVKPLAVTSSYRLEQLPELPTLSETVLPGFHVASWNMLFGPRGLPETI